MTDRIAPSVQVSRRQALAGAATVGLGAPLLVACGAEEPETATDTPTTAESSGAGPSGEGQPPAPAAQGLVSTADVPVGGGVVLSDERVVIVQPAAGTFVGYSAVCTHQGCTVSKVEDGMIVCPCHMSEFSAETGEPESGPAEQPLQKVDLVVSGEQISLA